MSGLEELRARAFIHRDAFPSRGVYMAARRGIRRLSALADADGQQVDALDLAEALRAAADRKLICPRSSRDEASALRHLDTMPALPQEVARRVQCGEPTLADAILCVGLQADWGPEKGRVQGALRRVAEVAGAVPAGIPATMRRIDALFDKYRAAHFGMRPSAYANLKSRVRRGIRLVDRQAATHLKASGLIGPWRALVDDVRADRKAALKGAVVALWPLVRYCHDTGISPDDVSDETVANLLESLTEREIAGPFEVVRKVIYAWERLQKECPSWPAQSLARLYASEFSRRSWPAFEALPDATQQVWKDYEAATVRRDVDSFADLVVDPADEFDDILNGSVQTSGGRYSAETLRARKSIWLQAVNIVHLAGGEVRSLGDVATPGVLKALLSSLGERQLAAAAADGREYESRNITRKNVASHLLAMARDAGVGAEDLETMEAMRDRVDPHLLRVTTNSKTGRKVRRFSEKCMGRTPAERLQQFRNPMTMLQWFRMPEILLEVAKRKMQIPARRHEGHIHVISALCHLLLRDVPLRRGDLGRLRIGGDQRELLMPPGKKGGRAAIALRTQKTGALIDRELSERTTAVLRWWIAELRPAFIASLGADPASPYLFPAAGAKPFRDEGSLNRAFNRDNQKYGGFFLNLHLMRHLIGKLILDEDPRQMELVRCLLSHKSIETTERFYAEVDQILAQRKVHDILAEAERKAGRLTRR